MTLSMAFSGEQGSWGQPAGARPADRFLFYAHATRIRHRAEPACARHGTHADCRNLLAPL